MHSSCFSIINSTCLVLLLLDRQVLQHHNLFEIVSLSLHLFSITRDHEADLARRFGQKLSLAKVIHTCV